MFVPPTFVAELDRAMPRVSSAQGLLDKDEVLQHLRNARQHAIAAQAAPLSPATTSMGHEGMAYSLVRSAMTQAGPPSTAANAGAHLSASELIGLHKSEDLDMGWISSFVHYLFSGKVEFPTHDPNNLPVTVMPKNVTIAFAGDWGPETPPPLRSETT